MILRIAAVALMAGCASTPSVPAGLEPMEAARVLFDRGEFEGAAEFAGGVADDARMDERTRADAAFQAAEAELADGEHLAALRRYRYVLENAPWSPHLGVVEDRLFTIADAFFDDPEYEGWIFSSRVRGVEALELAQAHFRRSDRADDALRRVAEYFSSDEVRDWHEAALTWERLLAEYPDSEWAERALWMAGHSRLQMCRGELYERGDLLRARDLLKRSLEVHPRGMAAAQAAQDFATATEMLAGLEVAIADFYRGRGSAWGERMRLATAALLYPQTAAGRAAAARLEAMGLDLEVLAEGSALNSIDAIRPTDRRFEPSRGVFGVGP